MARTPQSAGADRRSTQRTRSGFTVVELLVTLLLGSLVSAAVLQLLVGDLRQVGRLGRWLREQQASERALGLMREELQRAEWVALSAGAAPLPTGCSLAGRRFILQMAARTATGELAQVVYTFGVAPSSIWRGAVLMRCGPAYSLDGSWSEGSAVPRVLIDAVSVGRGITVSGSTPGVLRLEVERQLDDDITIRLQQVALAAPPPVMPSPE